MPHNPDDSGKEKARYRVVWLPPRPAANACRHLAEFDDRGRIVRFLAQTYGRLRLAVNGEEGLWERGMHRRARRWVREMMADGFYRDR